MIVTKMFIVMLWCPLWGFIFRIMEEIVAYTIDGKPLTLKEYKEKLDSAAERVKNGRYTTHEDLLKEIKTW